MTETVTLADFPKHLEAVIGPDAWLLAQVEGIPIEDLTPSAGNRMILLDDVHMALSARDAAKRGDRAARTNGHGSTVIDAVQPVEEELPDITAEDINEAQDLAPIRYPVPEWGGAVYIQPLSTQARIAFEEATAAKKKQWKGSEEAFGIQAITDFLGQVLVNAKSQRLFPTDEDSDNLRHRNWNVVHRVYKRAEDANKIGESDVAALAGNSKSPQRDGSSTS